MSQVFRHNRFSVLSVKAQFDRFEVINYISVYVRCLNNNINYYLNCPYDDINFMSCINLKKNCLFIADLEIELDKKINGVNYRFFNFKF